jgi:iron-sulfur cluster assembly protein
MSMLTVTEKAASKVTELLDQEKKQGQYLRVFVEGGGCSGFQYGLTFVDKQDTDDNVVEFNGFKVLVDPTSAMYLAGAEVDFIDGLNGSGFKISNPNAQSSCGCGHSFKA